MGGLFHVVGTVIESAFPLIVLYFLKDVVKDLFKILLPVAIVIGSVIFLVKYPDHAGLYAAKAMHGAGQMAYDGGNQLNYEIMRNMPVWTGVIIFFLMMSFFYKWTTRQFRSLFAEKKKEKEDKGGGGAHH